MRAFVALGLAVALWWPAACSVKKVRFKPAADAAASGHDAGMDARSADGAAGRGGGGGGTVADAAARDASPQDASVADAAAHDASIADAGHDAAHDAAADAGHDAALADAGAQDAAVHDAASGDAAFAEAGVGGQSGADAGGADAGDGGPGDGPPTCATNLVPAMTSATMPSGTVFSSGSYDATAYDAWQAFDASSTTMWISPEGQNPAYIGYVWNDDVPHTVLSYAITYSNGSILTRAPSAWTFEGLMGDIWITLDLRAGETNWNGFERRVYTIEAPGSYSEYRLTITDDNDPTNGIVVVSIGSLELLGCPP